MYGLSRGDISECKPDAIAAMDILDERDSV
jgi:hypothetical protein